MLGVIGARRNSGTGLAGKQLDALRLLELQEEHLQIHQLLSRGAQSPRLAGVCLEPLLLAERAVDIVPTPPPCPASPPHPQPDELPS